MKGGHRKSTPKVRNGKVVRKNRTDRSPDLWLTPPGKPVIERERPGRGYKHVVMKRDLEKFIGLLPNWDELSRGLRLLMIARGEWDTLGWYDHRGFVAICAWDREIEGDYDRDFIEEHREVLDRLGVQVRYNSRIQWTEHTARGFLPHAHLPPRTRASLRPHVDRIAEASRPW